ncbi:HAD hydrolase family protein, partial [Helcococcus ovis]
KMTEPSKNIFEKFKYDFEFVYSEPFYFEAMPKNVSKGETLVEVAEKLGYNISDTVSFGDQGNDFTMIKLAGTGVAMGNSIDELKEIADFVTKTNDEDGVAEYIEKYILN